MTVDPRWSIYLAVAIALLSYIAGAGALLTDAGLDPTLLKHMLAVISLIVGAASTVNAVLTGIPSKDNHTGFIVAGPTKPPTT